MRIIWPGQVLFAASMAALGVLSLISGGFIYGWQPVPSWIPGHNILAYGSGALMLASSTGLLLKRTARLSAGILSTYLLIWLLLLHAPIVATDPLNEGVWEISGENLVLASGAWLLFSALAEERDELWLRITAGENGMRIARFFFGVALLPIGLSHFVYLHEATSMVPAWLPYRSGWTFLTGMGHIAAGIGVLFGLAPRLAATLEGAMLGIITLLVNVPAVAARLTDRYQWTWLFVDLALTGAAWLVANSNRGTPWFSVSTSRKRMSEISVPYKIRSNSPNGRGN